jgi:hypothetical protein
MLRLSMDLVVEGRRCAAKLDRRSMADDMVFGLVVRKMLTMTRQTVGQQECS